MANKKVPEVLRHVLEGRAAMMKLALQQNNNDAALAVLDSAIRDAFVYGMTHVRDNVDTLAEITTLVNETKVYSTDR